MESIAIVVTAHNCGPLLTQALDSVAEALAVFRRDFHEASIEVALVDDGSRDDTEARARQAAEGRPTWQVLHRAEARSPAAARNHGARHVQGDLLFFLDGDDRFLPGHLSACYRAVVVEGLDFVKSGLLLADPVHPAWKQRIENSVVINLCVRRRCHEAIGGFPDYHLCRRDGDRLVAEADVFYKIEDLFYNRLLSRLFRGRKLASETAQYCRHPGNAYDRQYDKFRRPPGDAVDTPNGDEPFRLRLGEVIFNHLLEQRGAAVPGEEPERKSRGGQGAEIEDAEALCARGQALQAQGKHAEAVEVYRRALRQDASSAAAHHGLGTAQAARGRKQEALAHYRHALSLRPGLFEARTALGIALAELGQFAEAIEHLRQAAHDRPESASAQHNLGVALAQAGQAAEAVPCLEEALRLRPAYADACFNLGNALKELGRRDEALTLLRRAVTLRPDHAAACTNLGLALTEAGQVGEAAVLLEQAVRLGPKHKEAHNNLGLAHAALGRYEEALACHDEALRLDPRYVEAHTNRGSACKELGRLEEALACYGLALQLNPKSAIAHYNRALTLLQAGKYEQGWAEYEWRWQRPQTVQRALPQPRWDGSPLQGRTLLVWMEQGLGDRIQFLRYVPLLQARGGRALVECPAALHPLFSTCRGVDALVAEKGPLPAFDVQVPLMSLPGLLKTTGSSIPASVPYLEAEPARVASWRERLGERTGFRVGVVWQGNPRHVWDRHRSFALWRLAPLAAVPGVQLVSLQKGPGSEQVKEDSGFSVRVLEGLDEGCGTFQDTAAVLRCLDLVVCADTAVAHLAGALGVPTWLALAWVADWRWGREREDTPWYPSMRLFRQQRVGEWGSVFERIASELQRRCAR